MQLELRLYLIMIANKAEAIECRMPGYINNNKEKRIKIFMSFPFRLYSNLVKQGVGRDNY